MAVISVASESFESDVLQSDRLVLVDFWAEWCEPCKAMMPTLDEIAGEMQSELTIAKIDIETSPELAQQYNVRAVPSLMLFRGGDMIASMTGAQPKTQLMEWINSNKEALV